MDTSLSVDCGVHEQHDSDSSDSSLGIIFPDMTIVLTGNSSAVQFGHENVLLGEKQLKAENAVVSSFVPVERDISEHHISVINMIDLHEVENVDQLVDQLVNETEIHAFIFVVRLGQLTDAEKMGLEWLQRVFGDKVLQFVLILLTYETEEECSIIDNLKNNPVLEQLLEKCGGRYHTCNKMMNNQSEMRELMVKMEHMVNEIQQKHGMMYNTCTTSGHTSETEPIAQVTFVLLGNKQAGKSASGNTILGRQAFISKKSSKSVTENVAVESGDVNGFPVTVYDTPGLLNTDKEEIEQMINVQVFQKCESVLSAFLLVIRADRFTEEDRQTVEKIEELLGKKRQEKTWILFTRGDELEEENMTIQEFIEDTEELKTLVQKYGHRYHLFNNKITGSTDQARLLLVNILQMVLEEKDGGRLTGHIPESKVNAHNEPDTAVSSLSRRIVLLGKTGFGKSSSGNTILGQKEFFSKLSTKSVTSKCSVKHSNVSGRSVSVVDTPGFFDTQMKFKHLMKEIARSVYFSSPGPHAFLIVLRVDERFTEQEEQTAVLIKIMFGEGVLKYSIILFTHGDQLDGEPVEKLIEENSRLRSVIQQCGGRYHVFNNRDEENREQVEDLLQKIDSMIQQNGGAHYTNQMFEEAHRFRREEEERKRREDDERKQQEEKQIEETERERKVIVNEPEHHGNSEVKRRRGNPEFKQFYRKHRSYFQRVAFAINPAAIGQVVGACIGGVLGFIAGPAGIAVGTAFGMLVGTAVGGAVGLAVSKIRRNV